MATRLKTSQSARVIYLYGVTAEAVNVDMAGVDGQSLVEAIACGGLQCLISYVSRIEFADNLAAGMENLDWLSEAGVRHQRVVSAVAAEIDILPARFGTVFLDLSSLLADVKARKKVLRTDLGKIHNCEEWGVKVFGIQSAVKLPSKKPSSGRDYLQSKAAGLRKPPGGIKAKELDSLASALRRISVEMADGGRISAGQRSLQWQSSLLLKRNCRKKLEGVLKKFAEKWADSAKIECTGPWPPYSFVSRKREQE